MMLINNETELSGVVPIIFKELLLAASDANHPFRFVSFATVHQQTPEIRYVVLRAVDNQDHLFFFTDYRTEKIDHIQENSEVALLFYSSENRVQVRVRGTAKIHFDNDVAKRYSEMVLGDARKAYCSLKKPGTSILQPNAAHRWPQELANTFFPLLKWFLLIWTYYSWID